MVVVYGLGWSGVILAILFLCLFTIFRTFLKYFWPLIFLMMGLHYMGLSDKVINTIMDPLVWLYLIGMAILIVTNWWQNR